MSSFSSVMIPILTGVLGLVLGAVIGAWFVWNRRPAAGPEADAGLREDLAAAQTRADLLGQQLTATQQRQHTDQQLLHIVAPIGEQLNQLGAKVTQLERDRGSQYGQLAQQLRTVAETDAALMTHTQSLLSSLRANSARGNWGEVQLRRVVEAAGMLDHTDFTEQISYSGTDGKTRRPDMVVHLPGKKTLVVDAKAPQSAMLRADEIVDDGTEETQQLLASLEHQHAKAVRAHVTALSDKRYWDGLESSPELVMCFLPAESHLSTALRADPELLNFAFSRSVALVSPVSLLASLKAVAYSWQQEQVVDHARIVFEAAKELYDRTAKVGGHLQKMGADLTRTVTTYNSLVGSMESRLLPAVRKIRDLESSFPELEETEPVQTTPRAVTRAELRDEGTTDDYR